MPKILKVKDLQITVKTSENDNDYISLTDMAKWKGDQTGIIIANWLTTKYTLDFLSAWEQMNNTDFNLIEFHNIRKESGSNGYIASSSFFIKTTNAIGIRSSTGRYGGTFTHKDIALEFASWLSPEFKLYIIKEFQRLKEQEKTTTKSLEWQIKRSLAKTNYKIHTESIKKQLQSLSLTKFQEMLVYANEADMLNLIMFGKTAKEWEEENLELARKGLNIRDMAQIEDLIVLSGLETLNAYLINQRENKQARVEKLLTEAMKNFESIQNLRAAKEIKRLSKGKTRAPGSGASQYSNRIG
ncbi:MAG: KilA-N domain-containing protein [bacterium]